MGKKVVVAGHICLDITPVFPDRKINHVTEILQPGKLSHVGAADTHTGGAVANTGLAMKKLGADVSLMGKVGNDAFGEIVASILEKYDARSGLIVSEEESTSYTVVLAMRGIDRIFLHNPGANNHFYADDISKEALEEAVLFHFGYPPIMASMYENDGEELIRIMQSAKSAGAATSLDMAAVDDDSPAAAADWDLILRKVLPLVDFFVPSVEELCYMIDRERYEEWKARSNGRDITELLDPVQDIKPLADKCMEYGAKVLMIKCGAPGLYYKTADTELLTQIGTKVELDVHAWADKEGFQKSYVPEKILSGTGAGDTSIAAFLTAMLRGYPPEKCLQLAAATGACCVEAYDSLSGLRSFEELEEKIASGWAKND